MTSITQVSTFTNSIAALKAVTTSSNGNIMYGVYDNSMNSIYHSTDYGVNWSEISGSNLPVNGNYSGITTNSNGTILYTTWPGGGGLRQSTDSGVNWSIVSNINLGPIATDSTGTQLISRIGNIIYISSDSGGSWITSPPQPLSVLYVACSSNFGIRYVTDGPNVYVSTDPTNSTWTVIPGIITHDNAASLSCSADGSKVFLVDNAGQLLLYFRGEWSYITNSGIGIISSYSNGAGLLSASGATTFRTYSLTYPRYPCFKEDSNILCYHENREVYRKIQDLRKGDLVKTLRNGYVPIDMIGTTKLNNSKTNDEHRLYRCTPAKYPELTEDLIITGHHSILVSHITDEQRERVKKVMGKVYITDNKYRLAACIDDRAELYDKEGLYNIWHIALEHSDYYMNYGIYGNGLLVETCSKRYLKEISGMRLV